MYKIEISDENCNEFITNLPIIPKEGQSIYYQWDNNLAPYHKKIYSVSFMLKEKGEFDYIRLDVESF